MFSCTICQIFKNTFFYRTALVVASVISGAVDHRITVKDTAELAVTGLLPSIPVSSITELISEYQNVIRFAVTYNFPRQMLFSWKFCRYFRNSFSVEVFEAVTS